MKLSVMQENLARGLSVVSRAVSSRSTLPVLANVLLRTEDAGLKLTATNLEIGITYWVPGKIETDGATTVPARLLTDLVSSLPGSEKVDLELQGTDTLHLRCGRFATHVKGIDADEFPTIQTAGERPTTRISQKVLKKALEETIFAAASDEARPILTGVLARFEGSRLTLAAADNYRIAVRTIDILDPVEAVSVVIPARALTELSRILADTEDAVELVLAQARNQVLFHLDGIDLVSQADRRPVPELPAGPPGEPRQSRRVRPRGAPACGPPRGADRQLVGQHRQARGGRRRRGGHGHGNGRGGRLHRRRGGHGRGRPDHHRLQRPLPGRRAGQRGRRPVLARAQRAPLAGRLPAGGRCGLRPRRDARADDLLTDPATAPIHPEPDTPILRGLSIRDLRAYAALDAVFDAGPQLVWGPNAAGKTSLLEAIVLLAWGRSHRTSTDGELVRWGRDLARVEARVGRAGDAARGARRPRGRAREDRRAEAFASASA